MKLSPSMYLTLLLGASSISIANPSVGCKCFPGDSCWPSEAEWKALNISVSGNLIKTVPLGAPCHDPTFEEDLCQSLKQQWQNATIHLASSSSVMAPFFANQSCDPFQPRISPCKLGNYVSYAIAADTASDVQEAIAFARAKNIRLVIRNTGHDYLGRSTGAGALGVWTHPLKDIEFVNWDDGTYIGNAVKLGAGVQGFEILEAANSRGLVVVGGECPTVGIAGGYTQGGGHSALSTSFGLSVDNVLSWEVITADGEHLTANKDENADLFWALRGGGGGTFGVVISMTVKAHPGTITTGASLSFSTQTNSEERLWAGIQAFHDTLEDMVDAGTMVIHIITNASFVIAPLTAYNKTEAQVKGILTPLVSSLISENVDFNVTYKESKTYYNHYNEFLGPLPYGRIPVGFEQYGGRLIPRSVVPNSTETLRQATSRGVTWVGVATDVGQFGTRATTSVHPAWRSTLVHALLSTPWDSTKPWDDMVKLQELMTNVIMPEVEAATPGSGAYVNEADFRQPNFQDTFWGDNYKGLLKTKRKWDPENFFFVPKGVGSEIWSIGEDGRMCKSVAKNHMLKKASV